MGKKSPNKRKSDGSSNSEQTPKKIKFGQPNTEGSPQKFVAGNKTPKSAQKINPNKATPKSAQKFNPGNKTPKSAQKLNVGNKTPQSGKKNRSPNSKKNNQTPNSNKNNKQNNSPNESNRMKLGKFTGTAQLGDSDESGDSDYEVEQIIKPEKIRKTMNQFNDSDEDGESSNDNDVSQETVEDSSADEDVLDDDNDASDDHNEASDDDNDASDNDNDASDDDNDASDGDNDVSTEEIENAKNENNENDKAIKKKKNEQIAEPSIPIEKIKKLVNDDRKKGPGRYVLFIGNLPYDTTVSEVTEHFNKSCKVKHVRLPKGKDNNKPRGFGYIDVEDEMSYLKALSLHHSFIKGRRINVLYTTGGKKNSEDRKKFIKVKNMKLKAMRNTGKLEEGKKPSQKRSVRRAKKRAFDKQNE